MTSLLDCINAAQRSTAGMGSVSPTITRMRRLCLAAAEEHGPRLSLRMIARERYEYCAAGGNPWAVLWSWIAEAIGLPAPVPSRRCRDLKTKMAKIGRA